MDETVRDVVVIGGGISGLTTAWHLKQAGWDVCLLEAGPHVGGSTQTERRDGFLLEKGPFNVIVRDPAFEDLLSRLSGQVQVVAASKAARARYVYRKGRLMKVPAHPFALPATPLLSAAGKLRLMRGILISRCASATEETIEQAAVRRLGREAAETLVSAVVSGIFGGDIRQLSFEACFPGVARLDRNARSPILYGLRQAFFSRRRQREKPRRRWRGLVSIDGGLGALMEAMAKSLGSDLQTGCRVERVGRSWRVESDPARYEVFYREQGSPGGVLRCRSLVVAAPTNEAGRLLEPTLPKAAGAISTMASASLIVLNLGFRREDVGHPMEGYGFLVPANEPDFPLMGVLWADSIFPHHAPADHRLIRVFLGGSRDPDAMNQTDDELRRIAMDALKELLTLRGQPVLVDVCRHREAIPQYEPGHRNQCDLIRSAVEKEPGLFLIGNYLEGVSLNDCVRLATRVSGQVIAEGDNREKQPVAASACGV